MKWFLRLRGERAAHRRRPVLHVEALETRQVLSATVPAVTVDSATTADSRSVTVAYDVAGAPTGNTPLTFGVYRSAQATFDASAIPVGSDTLVASSPTLDLNSQPATAPGHHELTIPLPDGLPLNPTHPYVLVVANPTQTLATGDLKATAAFRVYTIGVVTHGGLEDKHWTHGPPWELQMAAGLRQQGYDAVIAYNWVAQSSTPGAAARQGPKLARMIEATLATFPAGAPVDLQVIGHSEGTVVNTQALLLLGPNLPSQLQAGWIEETLLDPHAANNAVPGEQYSVDHGPLGQLARAMINNYQSKAHDPPPWVPAWVDQSQVFFQQNPASRDRNTNAHIYNLWGQVPIKGASTYFNLTAAGATHSGKTGVPMWYITHIVPSLGEGAPQLESDVLSGALSSASADRVTYVGSTGPRAHVVVFVAPANRPADLVPAGQAFASPDGHWSITTRRLQAGQYRTLAVAHLSRQARPRLDMVPTKPLGLLAIPPRS
jgi:hypothetical protein